MQYPKPSPIPDDDDQDDDQQVAMEYVREHGFKEGPEDRDNK